MSVNSSSNVSLHATFEDCFNHDTMMIFTCFFVTSILLLPFFILVLCVGYRWKQWKSQRSSSPNGISSHTEVITYNMVVVELMNVLASCICFYGLHAENVAALQGSEFLYSISTSGQTLFHVLTCVERYMAVVHPVTYLGLRQASGARIRNITIGCVWLLCFTVMAAMTAFQLFFINLLLLTLSFLVVSFCSLSVLCVLIRPGPGDGGGNKERVDQSKKRAFHTMMAIMAALLLKFLASLVSSVLQLLPFVYLTCMVLFSLVLFHVPSSLVLPLLFLQKVGSYHAAKKCQMDEQKPH